MYIFYFFGFTISFYYDIKKESEAFTFYINKFEVVL